ncbi:MAG: M48 family metallopeptidase [Candidatus Eisenbacteria bacterium]|uniref:M48 family metallopeptidase n=1 Tax=Eiseniibacteriota bacterium TaxID=2212470 RepID=A0A937X6H3_UNCEI|nr:M48 family metallopeptidase [Candidatus Eisenbacteria bacterium]
MSRTAKSGGERARRLGRRSAARREEAEEREALLERLRGDAASIAARFGLRYRAIEAENGRVRRRYGSCHSDGVIKIRLRHVTTGRPLKYSSMVATLCHELAHLKHFHHGASFRDFNEVVLDYARRSGIYRPRAPGRPAAEGAPLTRPAPAALAAGRLPGARPAPPPRPGQPEQLILL